MSIRPAPLCVCFLLFLVSVSAQDKFRLDSLQTVLDADLPDSARIKTLIGLANEYANGDYMKSVTIAMQARELAAKGGDRKWIVFTDRVLANLFFSMGDYKKASTHYFDALKYYSDSKDTFGIALVYLNLGAMQDRLYEYDQALDYYNKALALMVHVPHNHKDQPRLLTSLYNNIAAVYQTKKDPDMALTYFNKTLGIARESGNKRVEAMVLNNMGKLYMEDLHELDKAKEYLMQSLELRRDLGDQAELSRSYIQLSEFYRLGKQLEKATEMAEEALRMGLAIGSLEVQKNAYLSLSTIMEDAGDLQASLDAFKAFKSVSDSIRSEIAGDEVARLQLQFDFDKAEQARAAREDKLRSDYTLTIIILAAALVIVALVAVVIRVRARQSELKRQSLTQTVEIKNRELTTNVMYLVKKNELINNVAERLLNLKSNLLPENQKVVNEIILDLQREGDSDMWREFEVRFNHVHGDFYEKLRTLYPDLSPADEKLCAFLRLNMSSKEIAAITRQSVKSVEVARARLRKKLNLTNTTSNLVSHLSKL